MTQEYPRRPIDPSRPIRAAVSGLRRGLAYLRLFRAMPDVEVVALVDPDPNQRAEALKLLAGKRQPREVNSVTELLEQPETIDFVVLAQPPIGRADDAIRALNAGVSVLSEIPAVWTMEEVDRLITAVEASTATYMLAENCCYWGFVDSARQMNQRGAFGRIFYAEAEMMQDMRPGYVDAAGQPTWRTSRKDSISYCTHSLGPVFRITGQYPTELICLGTEGHFEPGIAEIQTALIRLTDGGLVRLTVSLANAHWHGHRFALFGTRSSFDTGWVWLDQPRFWTADIPNLSGPITLPLGPDVPSAPPIARQTGEATMNWLMTRGFIESLRSGARPPIDVYDGVMFSIPGLLAGDSSEQGGRMITIPQYQLQRKGG